MSARKIVENWNDIAAQLLKIGATAYGGPAIMGIMQAELQEKRQWVSKERFVEGLSLVNMLPGATATQLGIFLGYARGGWWGGLLAGVFFVLSAFFVILGLTIAYAGLGVVPVVRGAHDSSGCHLRAGGGRRARDAPRHRRHPGARRDHRPARLSLENYANSRDRLRGVRSGGAPGGLE